MEYYFDDSNINKVAHYAFSDQKILRDSYMQLQFKQSWNIKQFALKLEHSINLRFFNYDYASFKNKCAKLIKTKANMQTLVKEYSISNSGNNQGNAALGKKDGLTGFKDIIKRRMQQGGKETNQEAQQQFMDLFSDKDYFPFPKKYIRLACALTMDPQLFFITAIAKIAPGSEHDNISTAIYNIYSYLDAAIRQNIAYTELDFQMP